jgi:hypothetical protein
MAEGVFQSLARKPPYDDLVGKIDSCGTGELGVLVFTFDFTFGI